MLRLIPRTIRGQLILGTALLQCVLVIAVFGYVYHQQRHTLQSRTMERVSYQVHLLSSVAGFEFQKPSLPNLQSVLDEMLVRRTIRAVRITDLAGNTLAYSSRAAGGERTGIEKGAPPLSPVERRQLPLALLPIVFDDGARGFVGLDRIRVEGTPVALAWVYPDSSQDQVDLSSLLRSAFIFALLAIAANALFSLLLARSVTRPLRGLLRGTKLLVRDPEQTGIFPLKTTSMNEAGELTRAFNIMVAALHEQRSGLNDTLALLDSLLANAPIGFAFFDRKLRYVRLNQFLAEMDTLPIGRHLGRSVQEIFSGPVAMELADAIERVFATGVPVRDLELRVELDSMPENSRTWLASLYPVRTLTDGRRTLSRATAGEEQKQRRERGAQDRTADAQEVQSQVGLVGAVFTDATDRKLSEGVLRRTEKLAATGRLAASIAHEINNPLEAVTNLLYLLRQQPLDDEALNYADMAQREVARVSQITQQTLRFYRQSSKPALTSPAELLDSVLGLYQGRLSSARVDVVRNYRDRVELLAFSGEMRQMFANLIGNALDAMPKGGRLTLSVRVSRRWDRPEVRGVRIMVADTGSGMTRSIRKRIFDAFFTTKETTGTGLGLWISSEIIDKHQGTVRVRSYAETAASARSGTVFMLFFPMEGVASQRWMETNSHGAPLAHGA